MAPRILEFGTIGDRISFTGQPRHFQVKSLATRCLAESVNMFHVYSVVCVIKYRMILLD
jgi:hypothetical protein